MSSQIIFKDVGAGLSSVKYMCAGDGVVADTAGGRLVVSDEGDGNGAGSVDDSAAGDGNAVGCTGVSGGLGTGEDGALLL